MTYPEIERLIYLVPFIPGLYGIYRTGVWRRALFWVYFAVFPVLGIQGASLPKGLRTPGGISVAIAGLLILNAVVFSLKRDKALSYMELAPLCLISPLVALLWDKCLGYLLY